MKQYTIEIVVNERSDEFFDELNQTGFTGCDDLVKIVDDALGTFGLDGNTKLVKFTDS